ncbi:MAG: hypothetical protein WAN38_08305, partial [Terriglobales bacterium]
MPLVWASGAPDTASQGILKLQFKISIEDFMDLRRFVSVTTFPPLMLIALIAPMHAAKNASCTFETFSAPSGYSLSMVNGVSDDGTVVGQLVDNNAQQFVAFTRSPGGAYTEYTVPQSSSTWLYGRSGTGLNAGFYQDNANPEHIHGFVLQNGQYTIVNYPKATNTWLFDVNQLGASVGSFSASASLIKGFILVNG